MKEKELQEELKEAAQKKALNLASWEEAENEKDQQKKLRAEQQRRLQEEQKGEEAEMKREMAQVQKKISSLKIEIPLKQSLECMRWKSYLKTG